MVRSDSAFSGARYTSSSSIEAEKAGETKGREETEERREKEEAEETTRKTNVFEDFRPEWASLEESFKTQKNGKWLGLDARD